MSAATPAKAGKLACLDGLRGIAVLSVILFHISRANFLGYHPVVLAALKPLRYGHSGVHLFLVLSGFCLALSWLRRSRAGKPQSYRDYLRARWWRIAPPYYVSLGLYLGAPALFAWIFRKEWAGEFLSWRQLSTHVSFLHGLWPDTIDAINVPYWSLSLEFQFYLLLPALCLLATRCGVLPVLAAVTATSLAWRQGLRSFAPGQLHLQNGFILGRLTEFALGIAVAFWYESEGRRELDLRSRLALMVATATPFAAAVVLLEADYRAAVDFLFGLSYASLLALALVSAERGGIFRRVIESRVLVAVGLASYSLYLTHSLIIERGLLFYRRLVPRPALASDILALAGLFAASLLFGGAYYWLVERHFLHRGTRSAGPKSPASGPTTVAAASLVPS